MKCYTKIEYSNLNECTFDCDERFSKLQSIWVVTFGVTVVLDADIGIAVGMIFSLLTLSIRIQRYGTSML